jgi:hypothetical protein
MNSLNIYIVLLVTLLITACGGGGGGSVAASKNYCVLNTNPDHFSSFGNCFQIKSIEVTDYSDTANDDANIYEVNRVIYLGFSYDENDFVGDLSEFTTELTFESDEIALHHVDMREPFDFIGGWSFTSSVAGKMIFTLVIKDQNEILDSKTVEINIVN